ncbi:hypothetical protein ECP02989421_3374, partial [Escherichia coli P0298942.1]
RGFGSRPECIRSLAFGEADYIVRVGDADDFLDSQEIKHVY